MSPGGGSRRRDHPTTPGSTSSWSELWSPVSSRGGRTCRSPRCGSVGTTTGRSGSAGGSWSGCPAPPATPRPSGRSSAGCPFSRMPRCRYRSRHRSRRVCQGSGTASRGRCTGGSRGGPRPPARSGTSPSSRPRWPGSSSRCSTSIPPAGRHRGHTTLTGEANLPGTRTRPPPQSVLSVTTPTARAVWDSAMSERWTAGPVWPEPGRVPHRAGARPGDLGARAGLGAVEGVDHPGRCPVDRPGRGGCRPRHPRRGPRRPPA